jgi:hypothetical protein
MHAWIPLLVAGHGGVTGGPMGTHGAAAAAGTGGGQLQPMKDDHKTGGQSG